MIRCQNCGAENSASDIHCYSCGTLLKAVIYEGNTTGILREETNSLPQPRRRWGTARFDTENMLLLDVRDYDAAPIIVRLDGDKVLGRSHKDFVPDVDLSNFDAYDRGVSRQHAILRFQNDTVVIVDNNSSNHTFLNGQRLIPNQPRIVRDGDEIRLGQLILRVSFEDVYQK